jgi:hypothetical protein
MTRVKVIALKRRREPDFDGNHLLTLLALLILLLIAGKLSAQPVNNNVCNATVINVGMNSPFTNVGATAQFGEPAIPTGSCTAQGFWCSSEGSPQLNSTVWFKFTVPAAGTGSYAIRVNGNTGTFDSQVALFSAATCADVTNGNAIRLGANDDSTGTLFNSYMTVFCLTPTVTYYILVDGYGTTTNSNFYVHIIELSDRNAVAQAGSDQTICYSLFPQFPVNGNILGIAGSTLWTTSGDGNFANPSTLSTNYSPGPNDKINGNVNLILSTDNPAGVCGISRDTLVLTVIPDSISGGIDKTICNNEEFITMMAQAFLFTSFQWTTTGDGTFDDPSSLTANYYPGVNDRLQPFVDVVLRGVSTQCFNTVYDTVRIFNSSSPGAVVNLGNDTVVCSGTGIALNVAQVSGFSTVQWTTTGNGTFSNPNAVNTNYTPGSNDIANGVVTVTLSAQGISPCQGSKSDSKQVFLQRPPIIHSMTGGGSYCSTSTISLTGDAEFYNDLHWQTSGDGSFTSPNDLATDYIPGPNDLVNGFISLSLTADATAPCNANALQSVNVSIVNAPSISVSSPSQSCAGDVISLNATVSNYQTLNWSSSGDGAFDDASSSKPKYTPGPVDNAGGNITFTVIVLGNSPCNAFFGGSSTLIIPLPVVNAGSDYLACTGTTVPVNASASSYSAVLWDTDGDGFFADPSALSTIYIPGPGDYVAGSVNLFIAADGLSPCSFSATDAILVTFVEHAVADAGPDDDIVAGQSFTMDGFATDASTVYWTTSGDGTFNDSSLINAVYTPGTADITTGGVTLTLHALDITPCALIDNDEVVLNIFPDALLAVKLYIEGFYNPGTSVPVLMNSGTGNDPLQMDSVTFKFHETTSPYNVAATFKVVAGTNGLAIFSVPGPFAGQSYYISIHHRNALETWTKDPVIINSFGLVDFTSSPASRKKQNVGSTKEGASSQ